jgi:hypothetical protein
MVQKIFSAEKKQYNSNKYPKFNKRVPIILVIKI